MRPGNALRVRLGESRDSSGVYLIEEGKEREGIGICFGSIGGWNKDVRGRKGANVASYTSSAS